MKSKPIKGAILTILIVGTMLSVFPIKAQFVGQIKIGVIGPVGWPYWSPAGMKEASEAAADEINAAGGVHLADGDYEIVLVFGDEKAYPTPDPTGAALEMERLITVEGCEFIMGGFRSEVTGALIEMAMDYETPFFINGASTSKFLSETVGDPTKYERYKYLFRVNPVNSTVLLQTIAGAAQFILPTKLLPYYGHDLGGPNPQVKVAVVMEDLKWTETMYFYLTNPAVYPAVLGPYANVTYAGRIPDGTTDCSPWLADVINSEARLLIHIFSGVTGVPFIMQWSAMNVKALPLGINVMAQLQTHWDTTGGGCEYEGILNFVGTRTPIIPGVTEVFWDNFVAKTGVWPIYTAFGAYNGIYILAEALEATGTKDKDALLAHFEDQAYETTGLTGKFKFDSTHDVFCNEVGPFWTEGYTRAMVVQWLAGRMEVVSPADQTYSKRWAIPPWMCPLVQRRSLTQVNTDGFGDPSNIEATPRVVFNGNLYVTVRNHISGGEIWRTTDGTTWTQVNEDGFGNPNNVNTDARVNFKGVLYAGTNNGVTGGEIWRTTNGTTWDSVITGGYGDSNNVLTIPAVVFNGYLYAGTYNEVTGGEIWRTTDGTTWTQVNEDGFGNPNNSGVYPRGIFNGYLYAGTYNEVTGGEIWRTTDGTTWTKLSSEGFGDANNILTYAQVVFNSYLYAATLNLISGGEIWRTTDGTTWTQVNEDGFGDPHNTMAEPSVVFGGLLYASASNDVAGGALWRSSDGTTWTRVSGIGFGDSRNCEYHKALYFQDCLYQGTTNYGTGGEIWRLSFSHEPLITDVNFDGKVDILDIATGAASFGTKPGDIRWNKEVDIDNSGEVNILDLATIAMDFGISVTLPLP